MALDDRLGVERIGAGDRLVPQLLDRVDGCGEHALVILDDEDVQRFGGGRIGRTGIGAGIGQRRRIGLRHGQQHRDAGAFAFGRMNLHLAVRLAAEGEDLAHPEPGALTRRLGGVEGVEHAFEHLRRHAAAGVDHLHRQRGGLFLLVGQGADRQRAMPLHRVARVDREVEERVLELLPVDPAGEAGAVEVERQRDAVADRAFDQLGEARDAVVDHDHLRPRRFGTRKSEQAAGQVGGAVCAVHRVRQVALRLFGRGDDQPLREFEPADDHREHIVEIMRDAAGELADRLHLLRLPQLRLGRLALAHLAAQRDVRLFEFGGARVDRRFELHRAVAFGPLLAPRGAAFALGADQRHRRRDRDHGRRGAEQRKEQDRLVEARAVGRRDAVALGEDRPFVTDQLG